MTDLRPILEAHLGDRYRLVRELGAGGMATVFLATDTKHDRQVALKVLRPEVADALGAERFLREIDAVSRLSHPHILPLYDSGEAGADSSFNAALTVLKGLVDGGSEENHP